MSDTTRGYLGVIPCLIYSNPPAAADWIAQVLGFHESPRCGEPGAETTGRVEMVRDGAVLVLGRSDKTWRGTKSHTRVIVDDVEDTCLRALCAGGLVESGPVEPRRQAVVSDPEGNRWELVPAPV